MKHLLLLPLLLALLGGCGKTDLRGRAPGSDVDAGDTGDTASDTDTTSDIGYEPCVPGTTGIEFYLHSSGGLEIAPGRGYELDEGVLTVDDWGTLLCGAELDDGQLDELRAAALAIDLNGLEEGYGTNGADLIICELALDLPPCSYATKWAGEHGPPALHDFAELVESIGEPIAESCPDAGPDGGA